MFGPRGMEAPRWWEPPAAPSSSVASQKAGRSLENETLMPGKRQPEKLHVWRLSFPRVLLGRAFLAN